VSLRALAEVNLAAVERNLRALVQRLDVRTSVCAVVKADGYGHGALPVARATLAAGAGMLAVATAGEASELAAAGLGNRTLVLGALSSEELAAAVASQATLVAWDERFVVEVAREAARQQRHVSLHVKLDSGLGRLGTREAREALAVAEAIASAAPSLSLTGLMTHFASADDDPGFTAEQLRRFGELQRELQQRLPVPLVAHAANSAATLNHPQTHLDMVRCGIALYGSDPMQIDPGRHGLEPALALRSWLAAVKLTRPGQSVGYNRRFTAGRETHIGTIPIGYGDGIPRRLSNNAEVLISGRRYPIVGAVSMDNITVDLGPAPRVSLGEPVTLIGADGNDRITAEDLARRLGTISYELLCGISRRVPRRHHHDGKPVET
jgi:alanine racemase